MKVIVWNVVWIACGVVVGGLLGGVVNYVVTDVASNGSGNEMLGVAALEGALFGILISVPIFGGIRFWRWWRRRD